MPVSLIRFLLVAAWVPVSTSAAVQPAPGIESFAGTWEGQFEFRGDTWPARLHVSAPDKKPVVTLDLPDLGMAWEPIPATLGDGVLEITVPFGIGKMGLRPRADTLYAERATNKDGLLTLSVKKGTPLAGVEEEDVRFTNGPATLVGTYVRPKGAGPFPAVVLVHGSGSQGRQSWGYRSAADWFVRRGFAVLYYDKRGVGASTGAWMTTSFADITDLADDLNAAVRWCQRRPEVIAGKVGVFGGSQALWVSALAHDRSAAVGFMILRGAPAVTPAEQELQRVIWTMRKGGFDAAAVEAARTHTALYFSVVKTGKGFDQLLESSKRAKQATWGEDLLLAEREDDLYWWKRNHDFDPAPLLKKITIPVLLLYGEADTVVPPEENVPRMKKLLTKADLSVRVFPRANHTLETPMGQDERGQWRFPRKAAGLSEYMDQWLKDRVRDGR
jgi:pimeloyl-ACP methyl ester carboxylesterase